MNDELSEQYNNYTQREASRFIYNSYFVPLG